ncbi:hypothetical protein M408DRAFT_16564 [Serendipita vermifera MAFF 305830]|uniref:Uncharacterized protein n=1 Tax=Serendipita vermifera MAFF 305830 TaxID=933852 RepID=A0A0C3ASD1_SERVB|nr:hypothetical protein M408DRAFT_16564 [Serendipita vermifera MAFF 305830]
MTSNIPPTSYPTAGPQSPVETSPAASSANIATAQILLERSEIDKSLKSLENLVSLLYEYAQVWQTLVGLDKKLVKAFKDAASMKRSSSSADGLEWPANIFATSSLIFDSASEVDGKYAKLVEREYEAVSQDLKKWLKKLKKEDKALDEYTTAANAKIKAAGQAYEKKQKKGVSSSPSGPSLDSYSALLSTLSSSVSSAKHQHTLFISTRHITTLYTASGSVGRIADAQWMKTCELLRRCATSIGTLGEARSYVEGGWRGGTVVELPLNLPVEPARYEEPSTGVDTLASRNNLYIRPPLPTGMSSTTTVPPTEQKPASTAPTPTKAEATSPKQPAADKNATSKQEGDTIKAVKENTKQAAPPTEVETQPPAPKAPETKGHEATVTTSTGTSASAMTGTTRSGGTETSAAPSSLQGPASGSISSESKDKDSVASKAPKLPNITALSEVAAFEPNHTLARTPAIQNKKESSAAPRESAASSPLSPKSPASPGPGTYFPPTNDTNETSRPSPTPIYASRSTTGTQPTSTSPQSPPNLPHAPASYAGRAIGRTMSIDSTTSNGSLVAALRDRYTPSSPPPPPPPQPTGRRGEPYSPREREGGRVSDMASRFTPIEGPLSPTGSSYARAPNFPVPPMPSRERGDYNNNIGPGSINVGDTLPLRTPLRRSSVDEFGSSFAGATQSPGGGGRRGDTMPHADRRQTMAPQISSRMGPQTTYDIHLSELELQQREMELEIHRQRLQLAKEREALSAREREREAQDAGSDYHSGREGRAYGDRYGRSRDIPASSELPYARGGYSRDVGGYDSPSGREVYTPPRGYDPERNMDGGRNGTPRLGGGMIPDAYGDRAPSRGGEPPYQDMSTGMGVLGLGLPPGAAPSRGSTSRESLSLSNSGYAASNLSPPAPQAASKARDPSPRRSAESSRPSEKEKGGTWLGKGLKRFSMNN